MTKNVQWQDSYQAAMLELDSSKLQERIKAAVTATELRLEEPEGSNRDGTAVEQYAMADALENLRTLQRVELKLGTKLGARSDNSTRGEAL